MRAPRGHFNYSNIVATIALFVALGGGAYAATNGTLVASDGAIRGCVPKQGGTLTVIGPTAHCRKGLVPVMFNAKGQNGAQGPQGAQGAQGAQGSQGPAGPAVGPAGGILTGSYPNPELRTDAIDSMDLEDAVCGVSAYPGELVSNGRGCWVETLHHPAGIYCVRLPFSPVSGLVSMDAAASGAPVGYVSVEITEVDALCGSSSGYQAVVETYGSAGGSLTDEVFHAIFM